jgi:hypothetical protein
VEIKEWLLGLPEKYDSAHGFPDAMNFISFSFNYDATQIFADFPFHKVWEITRRRSFKSKRKTNAPVLVDGYAVDFVKSKWLKIWKLRYPDDPKKAFKPKLDKDVSPILKSNGKPEMEIDAVAYICIHDAFGFYQRRFTTVSESLIKQGYVEKADHDEIVANKEQRAGFAQVSMEQIKHYCHLELVTLSKALTVLRDGFDKMGERLGRSFRLRTWSGAGSAAATLIRAEDLKNKHYSPDIAVRD